jgi:Arc/MetJ family transcription regulator
MMNISEVHDYARRLVGAHGARAELEAAQRATECEKQGDKIQAQDWRRIQAALKEIRGPRST